MIVMLILAALAGMGVIAARLAARAVAAEHLLVLRPERGGMLLFERDGDGRYQPRPWTELPAALRRFVCGVPALSRVRADG